MANINDYLLWRGDIPVSVDFPFNQVDSMILARFSYLLLEMIETKEEETVSSVADKLKLLDETKVHFHNKEDKTLVTRMGSSIRFGQMKVTDFREVMDGEAEKQFAAVTVHYSENQMYVSYRGTDATLVGWKEDFNMSFLEHVPAQVEGLAYLREVSEKYPMSRIRIGGHSKGGNVAIYSAITAPENIKRRVIEVNNFDGPGFPMEVTRQYENEDILARIHTFIPQDSVIGRILEHAEESRIVQSTEKMLMQHDIFSWQIERDHLIILEELAPEGDILYKTFAYWLKNSTKQQREVFIDGMYKILTTTNADNLDDLYSGIIRNLPALWKTYRDFPSEDRKTLVQMWTLLVKTYSESVKEHEKKAVGAVTESIEEKRD